MRKLCGDRVVVVTSDEETHTRNVLGAATQDSVPTTSHDEEWAP
jgi:hypothetical protein